jgi:hypothetical protein
MSKRAKVESIRNPTLFEMDKHEQAGQLVNPLKVERPYSEMQTNTVLGVGGPCP